MMAKNWVGWRNCWKLFKESLFCFWANCFRGSQELNASSSMEPGKHEARSFGR